MTRISPNMFESKMKDCYQLKVQNQPLWWYGCISAHGMADLHMSEGTVDAEAYFGILEGHRLLSRWRRFPGTPCLFQQDNARSHSAGVTTMWLRRHRVCVFDWPACSPDLSHIENVLRIMKGRIRKRQTRTVKQLRPVYMKNGQQFDLQNCNNKLYLQFPNDYKV